MPIVPNYTNNPNQWLDVTPVGVVGKASGYITLVATPLPAYTTWLKSSYIVAQINFNNVTNKFVFPQMAIDFLDFQGGVNFVYCLRCNTGDTTAGHQSVKRYRLTSDSTLALIKSYYSDFNFSSSWSVYNGEVVPVFGNLFVLEAWSTRAFYGAGSGAFDDGSHKFFTTILKNKSNVADTGGFEITSWNKSSHVIDVDLLAKTNIGNTAMLLPLRFKGYSAGFDFGF